VPPTRKAKGANEVEVASWAATVRANVKFEQIGATAAEPKDARKRRRTSSGVMVLGLSESKSEAGNE